MPVSSVRRFVAIWVFLLATAVTGCSTSETVRAAFGGKLPLTVTVVPGANDDTAIAVDFVVVYDQKLLDELLKVSAADWFATKSRFQADHPRKLEVETREWVPGQRVGPMSIEYRAGARRVVVFAHYQSSGEHRAVVPPQQASNVVLGETDLKVEARR